MSNGSPKRSSMQRRLRRNTRKTRQARHVARLLGRDMENQHILILAMLAQAGGKVTFSRGTLNQIVSGEVPAEYEVVDGEHEGERVVQFKAKPEPADEVGTKDAVVEGANV